MGESIDTELVLQEAHEGQGETGQPAAGEQSDNHELAKEIDEGLNRAIRRHIGRAHLATTAVLAQIEMQSGGSSITVLMGPGVKRVTYCGEPKESEKEIDFILKNNPDGESVDMVGFAHEGYETEQDAQSALYALPHTLPALGEGWAAFTIHSS